MQFVQQSCYFIQYSRIVAANPKLLAYLCTQKRTQKTCRTKIEKYEEVFISLLHDGCCNDSICTVYIGTLGTGPEVNPESWTQLKGSNEKGI